MIAAGLRLPRLVGRTGRRRAGSTLAWGAGLVVLFVAVLAVIGPAIAPHSSGGQDLANALAGASSDHPLGTDDLGRDVLSRVIAGARPALVGPLIIAFGALALGGSLGLLAGYRGGRTDALIMRWVDLMYALPSLLLAIVVVGVIGGGYYVAVALLLVLTIPADTRVVRAAVLEQRNLPYVEAARCVGTSPFRIATRHIWPNVLPIELANAFVNFAVALVALSALSFLGVGAPPGTADWGRMLAEGRTLLVDNPLAVLAPGLMLVLLATSMNLLGDWTSERMSDRGLSS